MQIPDTIAACVYIDIKELDTLKQLQAINNHMKVLLY